MASLSPEALMKFIRGISVRQIRLSCGLVLFAYLVSHFLNHALGNISMEALADGVYFHTLFWQFLPVAILFYTAALVHAGLGLWALYERRQFRWKAIEPLQLVLGLSIPALIITHIAGVRLGQTLFGHEKLYPQVLFAYWIVWPYKIWLMLAVMTVAWVHGCIGLYFWLRMKPFYRTRRRFCSPRRCWFRRWPCSGSIRLGEASSTTIARNGGRKISRPGRSAHKPNKPY
jgi:adenylate cyclase